MKIIKMLGIQCVVIWLLLVFVFFILTSTSYVDYKVRAQIAEALSLTSSLKGFTADFYHAQQRCPTITEIPKTATYKGKYVEQVYFTELAGSDHCYIVARINNNSNTDRRIRNKSLMLVMEPASDWQYQVTCQTNLVGYSDNCTDQL